MLVSTDANNFFVSTFKAYLQFHNVSNPSSHKANMSQLAKKEGKQNTAVLFQGTYGATARLYKSASQQCRQGSQPCEGLKEMMGTGQ